MLPKQELLALSTPSQQAKIIHEIAALLTGRGWLLASAESCTGGLVAAACTDVAGSSLWFERGFVCYSNAAKTELLGVPAALIEQHGAVSGAVVRAMAEGALAHSRAQASLAVTGIAGPGGGSADKPVGLVHFAAARASGVIQARHHVFVGDRDSVRAQAVLTALEMLAEIAG